MWVLVIVALIVAIFVVHGIVSAANKAANEKRGTTAITKIAAGPLAVEEAFATGHAIGIDAERNFVVLSDNSGPVSLPFAAIIAVEVVANGQSLTKAVGAAVTVPGLLGPVMIGAGSQRHIERIRSLSLKIYTTDIQRPVREVFVVRELNLKKGGLNYDFYSKKLDRWYGRLRVIVEGRPLEVRKALPAYPNAPRL